MMRSLIKARLLTMKSMSNQIMSGKWTTSTAVGPRRRCINTSALIITPSTDTTRKLPPTKTLKFGTTFAPHMLSITFSNGKWSDPVIKSRENASIPLASACLNYGLTWLEGKKAYRSLNDSSDLRLFRPDLNMKRLSKSMERISLPGHDFDHDQLLQCISRLITLDQEWVTSGFGYSLYLRPNVVAINEKLGEGNTVWRKFYCTSLRVLSDRIIQLDSNHVN